MSGYKIIDGLLVDGGAIDKFLEGLLGVEDNRPMKDRFDFEFQPKQKRLIEACGLGKVWDGTGGAEEPYADRIGYGGAVYGAKTYGLLGLAGLWALVFPGSQIGFFRRTYTEMEGPGAVISKSYEVFSKVATARNGGRDWHWENGSDFYFQHCEQESDVYKYQGKQIDLMLFDEATSFTWTMIDFLLNRNRVSGKNGVKKPISVMCSNPGGVGHSWYMQMFGLESIQRWDDGGDWRERKSVVMTNPNGQAINVHFIPSYIQDNQIGLELDPEYEVRLRQSDPGLAEALIKADWKIFGGMAFPKWRADKHVVKPFNIPKEWPKWRAVDWGYDAPFVCLWAAKNPQGRVFIYREFSGRHMTDDEQAEAIIANSPYDENVSITYADPKSYWVSKNRYGLIFTTSEVYMDHGVPLWEADNDRLSGKKKIDMLMADMPDGKPGLQIFDNCIETIRTLPKLSRSKNNPEDVDTDQEDHWYDAMRYLMTNPNMFRTLNKERKGKVSVKNPWVNARGL